MDLMQKITSLCQRRGFIFPGSDIYGGLANSWDFGPLGVQLKRNLKKIWWKHFVENRSDMLGLDSAILMNPKVWEASGHLSGFSDPLTECKKCHQRFRADDLIEKAVKSGELEGKSLSAQAFKQHKILNNLKCPNCCVKEFTKPQPFNLMFKTFQGPVEDKATEIYMRPETAQGIFVNFKNILNSRRIKLPFGVGQIGKAFRNEITPGNFIFRTREFEQMEIEYFVKPGEEKKYFKKWSEEMWQFFTQILGVQEKNLRRREHKKEELSHYSNMTEDIEYNFPFGWGELSGLASRTNYDLSQHEKYSGVNLKYKDPICLIGRQVTQEEFIPYVIEPSFGCDRSILTLLIDAYKEEKVKDQTRVVMKFKKQLAPVQVAILPLSKKENLSKLAREIYDSLKTKFICEYDETQSIGKRYRRQDEIGTPYCITIDFESLEDKKVTVRDRDTMKQERVDIEKVLEFIKKKTRNS